jgi:hypothetical protein
MRGGQLKGLGLAERFELQSMPEPNSGCWLWIGAISGGYGTITEGSGSQRKLFAHRVAYQLHKGEIAPDLEIDHKCRNTRCVNPEHLVAVSHRVNMRRGNTFAARNLAKTTCPHGHALTPIKGGRRYCVVCCKIRKQASRDARRSARSFREDR